MKATFEVGSMMRFGYNGKERAIRVESVKRTGLSIIGTGNVITHVTGWDYTVGGYRTFKREGMEYIEAGLGEWAKFAD